jgi:hypothetical protein
LTWSFISHLCKIFQVRATKKQAIQALNMADLLALNMAVLLAVIWLSY